MMDSRLEEIKERLRKATKGPWKWREQDLNERIYKRTGRSRSKCRKKDGVWLYHLSGPCRLEESGYVDGWDYPPVMYRQWSQIRGTGVVNATPTEDNAAFIENAWTDIQWLVEQLESKE
jgi:hypothetical protein